MSYTFPSDAWVKAFMEKLNASPTYAETAKAWEGDISFVVEPDAGEMPGPMTLYLDLWHGKCREAREVTGAQDGQPAFVLTGTLRSYVQIITGKLDPIQALLTRRLKVQGNMIYLMRNVPTILEFVRTASHVDTEFLQ